MLDLLDRLDIRATFFPIATRAVSQPELIRRIKQAGHTVGLHCSEHVRHSERDQKWVERDTEVALDLLGKVGVTPELWRTPWGDIVPFTEKVAALHGLRIVGWTLDTHDWRGDSAEEMLHATSGAIEAGAIVLAHDGIGPGARRSDLSATLGYVELAARLARERDLEIGVLT